MASIASQTLDGSQYYILLILTGGWNVIVSDKFQPLAVQCCVNVMYFDGREQHGVKSRLTKEDVISMQCSALMEEENMTTKADLIIFNCNGFLS